VLVVTVVAVAAVPGGVPVAELRMLLPGAAVVGGLVLVIQGVLLWHGSGRATPLWLSAGALTHIVWTADLAELDSLLAGNDAALPWLAPAAATVLWAALAAGAVADRGRAPASVDGPARCAGAAVAILAELLALGLDALRKLSGDADGEGVPLPVGLWLLLPAAWAVVTVTLGVQGHRRRAPVLG
jgi:hypothetical protein